MTELYAEYINEILGGLLIEVPQGFVIYKIEKEEMQVLDVYVRPMARKTQEATSLFLHTIRMAKENKCRRITGNIWQSSRCKEFTLLSWLRSGVQISAINTNCITVKLEL